MGMRNDLAKSIIKIRETIVELDKCLAELEAHLEYHLDGTKKSMIELSRPNHLPAAED